jgi:hypothetical protein
MSRSIATLLCLLLAFTCQAVARDDDSDDYHISGVERIVAIGDLHGDYEQYVRVMQSAGLLDSRGRWDGGATHLVQTGDITDRGPDSRKIIDHLVKVSRQARRKGGAVHMLIGNHEAMNVTGDLRYVHAGEYQAFQGRNSERLQQMQWQAQINWMQTNLPEFATMDLQAYRLEWEKLVPLGWVEHRQAWTRGGDYFDWTRGNRVAVKVNDTVFLHGGISAKYCTLSLQEMTEQVIAGLESYDPAVESIVDDQDGPLWYRGMVTEDEEGVFSQTLDNILERYGAKRVVIGHTPTGGVVWPRFDGRVVANDTGIAAHYGSHFGILELTANGAVAIYGEQRIPLPAGNDDRIGYLEAVIEADANNALMKKRLARLLAPPAESAPDAEGEVAPETEEKPLPTPGTCR